MITYITCLGQYGSNTRTPKSCPTHCFGFQLPTTLYVPWQWNELVPFVSKLKINKGKKKMHTHLKLSQPNNGREWKARLPGGSMSAMLCMVLGVFNTHKNGCSLASKPFTSSWSCKVECGSVPLLPKVTYRTDLGDCVPTTEDMNWCHHFFQIHHSQFPWFHGCHDSLLATNTSGQLGWNCLSARWWDMPLNN